MVYFIRSVILNTGLKQTSVLCAAPVEPATNQTASEQLFNSARWNNTECFWIPQQLFTAKNALTSPFDMLEGNHRYSSDWKCRWFQVMCNKRSEE